MSAQGKCTACGTNNEYSKIVCDFCSSRLPWSDAVMKNAPVPLLAPQAAVPQSAVANSAVVSPVGCLPLLGASILSVIGLMLFMQIFGIGAGWFLVLASAVAVGFDASKLGVRQGQIKGFGDSSVGAWVAGCLLLWGVVFPAYLLARPVYVELNARRERGEVTALHGEKNSIGMFAIAGLAILIGLGSLIVVGALTQLGSRKAPISGYTTSLASEPFFAAAKYTKAQYNQLATGMSHAQAAQIMGDDGEQNSRVEMGGFTSEMYSWANADGTSCNATFQNGRLEAKAQLGLR